MMLDHTATPGATPLTIMLVEDDDGDAKALRRAFGRAGIAGELRRAIDGVEALAILRRAMGHVPPRYLLVVDLNMPRMNGIELLRTLRADPELHRVVAFVLTTSGDDRDIADAYDCNIAGYIRKDNVGEGCQDLVRALDQYWRLVDLPDIPPGAV